MTQNNHFNEHEIAKVIYRVGYLLDGQQLNDLGQVFHQDIFFSNPGRLEAQGLDTLIEAFSKIAAPARSHSITNVIVTMVDDSTAESVCKALTVRQDDSITPAEYRDKVVLNDAGWRIIERRIRPL